MLVAHCMTTLEVGTVGSSPASNQVSRAMLLQSRLGMVNPHRRIDLTPVRFGHGLEHGHAEVDGVTLREPSVEPREWRPYASCDPDLTRHRLAGDFLEQWDHSLVQLRRHLGLAQLGELAEERRRQVDVDARILPVALRNAEPHGGS